jgi:hypothetical protein
MANPPITGIKALLATPELPDLGLGPRAGIQTAIRINETLDALIQGAKLSSRAGELVRALILLWHDHLDEAHLIAQAIETVDGSLVHGIMHRREPDYGNAKYWFYRAGRHPCFLEIGKRAIALLRTTGEDALQKKLTPHVLWEASAFVDACEDAARKPGPVRRDHLLRELQRIEMETLLEYFSGDWSEADQE